MKSIILNWKIKKELSEFKKFKNSYSFEYKDIEQNEDGSISFDGKCVKAGLDAECVGERLFFIQLANR